MLEKKKSGHLGRNQYCSCLTYRDSYDLIFMHWVILMEFKVFLIPLKGPIGSGYTSRIPVIKTKKGGLVHDAPTIARSRDGQIYTALLCREAISVFRN